MKILQLQMEGLRSHRTRTTFDLADRELVALVGRTGAGKSSVLEGVCFALFGESTSGGSGGGASAYADLSSDGRTPITVRLEFAVGATRYQLTRSTAPPAGKSTSWTTTECWLHQLGESGSVVKAWDKTRPVNDRVRQVLGGLTREQFCQSVMLPQNRFAALIEAPRDDRNRLLDNLLGLSALRASSRTAKDRLKAVRAQISVLEQRRGGLAADPAAAAAAARDRAAAYRALEAAATTASQTLDGLVDQSKQLGREIDRFRALAAIGSAAGRAGEIAEELARLARAGDELVTQLDAAASAAARAEEKAVVATARLATVEAERGSAVEHAVAEAAIGEYTRAVAERPLRAGELDEAGELVRLRTATATDLRAAADAAAAAAAETDRVAGLAADAARVAGTEAEARRTTVAAATAAAAEAVTADRGARDAAAAVVAADKAAATKEKEAKAALAELEQSDAELEAARHRAAAAAAAAGCAPGEPCPVCDRDLPAGWSAPREPDLELATKGRAAAAATCDAADTASRRARREADRARAAADQATAAAGIATDRLRTAAVAAGLEPPPLDQVPVWVTAAHAAVAEADATAARLRTEAETRAGAAAGASDVARHARAGAEAAERDLLAATAELEARRRAAAEAEARVAECHGRVPARWRARLGADAIALLAEDRAARQAAAEEAEKAAGRARSAADDARRARDAMTEQVDIPTRRAADRLAQLREEIDRVATELGETETGRPDARATGPDTAAATDPDTTGSAGVDAARAGERAARAAAGVATRLAGLAAARAAAAEAAVEALGPEAAEVIDAVSAAAAAVTGWAAESEHDRLQTARADPLGGDALLVINQIVGSAGARALDAEADAGRLENERALSAEIDDRLAALGRWRADLQGAVYILEAGAFPDYARRVRLGELAQVASDLFRRMSNDRYRFEDDLRVHDGESGAVRSATTLSGGEKFQASLALALAVAEIAGRSGVALETLFLDEGFSGLDARSLDLALDTIETEVAAGRTIVLITHIGAVAQRVEDVFLVEPDGAGGCRTAWLDDAQRYELGADLDLVS